MTERMAKIKKWKSLNREAKNQALIWTKIKLLEINERT